MPPKKPGKITRSEASRQQLHIESLGSVGSPPKTSRRARQKVKKQASKSANSPKKRVNSPGSESGITSSNVVTETKKKESQSAASSEEDEDTSTHSGESKKEEESQSSTRSEESKEDKGSKNKESDKEKGPTSQAKMSNTTPFDAKL